MALPWQGAQPRKGVKLPTKRQLGGGSVDPLFELTAGKRDAREGQPEEKTQDGSSGGAVLFRTGPCVSPSKTALTSPYPSSARAIVL